MATQDKTTAPEENGAADVEQLSEGLGIEVSESPFSMELS
jgi:hypothetical protein